MSDDWIAIVLPSGRGLRYALLSPTQVDNVMLAAAKTLTPSASTRIDLDTAELKFGVTTMVKQVSRDRLTKKRSEAVLAADGVTVIEPAKVDYDVKDPAIQWDDFNYGGVHDDPAYNKLFTARDHEALKGIYRREHTTTAMDVDAIMGKAVPVAAK